MKDNNFGPYWAVNSQEMGVGVIIVIVLFIAPVYPLAYLGWYIGDDIIGNNFAKWGLSLLCVGLGYLALRRLSSYGFRYVAMAVFGEYLAFDAKMSAGRDDLYMVSMLKEILSWGLNNT